MASSSALNALYTKQKSPLEFKFDNLTAPPLLSLLTPQDIYNLNQIAKSVKLSGKIDEKYKLIDSIMRNRGFVKLHAGTNRVVYRFSEDQRFVVKIAVDRVGLGDNPAEFKNQFLLKPFVTRVFEVSPCGTVGLFERVDAVLSREEFMSIADDVFVLITKVFVGKYVLEDIGSYYFMNWGTRKGFGPVLLDFPYIYELDGNKLYCNANPIIGRKDIICKGEIDYDDGFNNLICTKCGKTYNARDLQKNGKNKLIIVGGKKTMHIRIRRGTTIIKDNGDKKVTKVIEPDKANVDLLNNITIEQKTEIPSDSIFNRQETPKVEKTEIPTDSIFRKIEEKEDDPIIVSNATKDVTIIEDNKEELSITDELDQALEIENYEEENDEDEYEEYDQYLSNRQRSNNRSSMKSTRKKHNDDFNGF